MPPVTGQISAPTRIFRLNALDTSIIKYVFGVTFFPTNVVFNQDPIAAAVIASMATEKSINKAGD
tara:strand:+ start:349 stop:543 length:195 start_codon:yes stop_codon:yes gene_type:complete